MLILFELWTPAFERWMILVNANIVSSCCVSGWVTVRVTMKLVKLLRIQNLPLKKYPYIAIHGLDEKIRLNMNNGK